METPTRMVDPIGTYVIRNSPQITAILSGLAAADSRRMLARLNDIGQLLIALPACLRLAQDQPTPLDRGRTTSDVSSGGSAPEADAGLRSS
jgi:hypothetical protein